MDLSPWDFPCARVHHVLRLVLLFRSQLMVFFLHGLDHLFRQLLDLLRQFLQVLGRELGGFCHHEIGYTPQWWLTVCYGIGGSSCSFVGLDLGSTLQLTYSPWKTHILRVVQSHWVSEALFEIEMGQVGLRTIIRNLGYESPTAFSYTLENLGDPGGLCGMILQIPSSSRFAKQSLDPLVPSQPRKRRRLLGVP